MTEAENEELRLKAEAAKASETSVKKSQEAPQDAPLKSSGKGAKPKPGAKGKSAADKVAEKPSIPDIKLSEQPSKPPEDKQPEQPKKVVKTMRIRITGHVEDEKGLVTGEVDMEISEAKRLIQLKRAEAIQ